MRTPVKHTLFQRLKADPEYGLEFEYMGFAEYEAGVSHTAAKLMTIDVGAAPETIKTNIVLGDDDFSFARVDMKSARWKRMDKISKEIDMEREQQIQSMLDGQPLLLRFLPSLTPADKLDSIMGLTNLSEQVFNKGGITSQNTRAWLTIYPVVGILYHPNFEENVNSFVDKLGQHFTKDDPDAGNKALLKASRIFDEVLDAGALKTLVETRAQSAQPTP